MTWIHWLILGLIVIAIAVAIFVPKARRFVGIGLAVVLGGLAIILGRKKPEDPNLKEEDKPPSIPVATNPAAPIEKEVANEHDEIDALDDTGDLADAWSAHGKRAGSSDLSDS